MTQLLTVSEAAERLSVSERTIYRLLEDRELERIKVGATTRIPESDIERFVDRRRPLTAGQLRAFHALAHQLDKEAGRERGESKREALAAATKLFSRQIKSPLDLRVFEASHVLDALEHELISAQSRSS